MLVLNRSGDPDATALAARMLRDHRGLAGQLSLSGRRLNMLPASTLRPREQSWLTQLEAEADPAAAYHQQMEQAHQHSLALHAGFSQRGTSPTLRGVAANAAQVEKRHWTELRRR
jgi:putative membrane protein